MRAVALRNVKLFFRDRSALFFSFLSVLIILGLYMIFLGDMLREGAGAVPGVDALMNSWVMAGILAVTSVTSTLGAYGIMVEDRHRGMLKDFTASPLRRRDIAGGYIASAVAIGFMMSLITLLFAELFIVLNGGEWLSWTGWLRVIGLIALSVLSSSSMVFLITSFIGSVNAFSSVSTIIGTLIGFLTGIYIPIGSLPAWVQVAVKLFPVSHAGALLREVMMEEPLKQSFSGAPPETVDQFKLEMGIAFEFGSYTTSAAASLAVLALTTIICYGLSILKLSRKG